MGDMNLCTKRWDDASYQYKEMSNKIKDFMYEENCSQIVNDFTWIRSVNGSLQRSCLDHATVNCVGKVSSPVNIGVGKSDHLGILITKTSKEVRTYARTTGREYIKISVVKLSSRILKKPKGLENLMVFSMLRTQMKHLKFSPTLSVKCWTAMP